MSAKSWGPNENGRFTLAELERMPGFRRTHGGTRSRSACPIHGGDNPDAFEVVFETGRGYCFTHQCWGYLDDGQRRGGDRARRAPYGSMPPPVPPPAPVTPPDPERIAHLRRTWPRLQAAFPDSPAEAYLVERGIPPDVAREARVGYDAEGLLAPTMRGRVVFPLATLNGEPVNAMGRVIRPDDPRRRWDALTGPKGYFHPAGLRLAREQARTLYLCEGTVDVLAFLAGGIRTAVAICGASGVVRREHLRGIYRVVICLDADATGQERGPELGWMVRTTGCEALQLTRDELEGAKDVAEYWQARGTLPPGLLDLAREEETTLDADLIADEARRNDAATIARRVAGLRTRWDAGETTRQVRGLLADWHAIAAARARLDASAPAAEGER